MKRSFYSGGFFKDLVIKDYMEGLYLRKDGVKIRLEQKMSRYNREIIDDLKRLNTKYYSVILVENVATDLIKINSNYRSHELGNVWNLKKAQSGTIKFNRALRKALETYVVDRQKIYDHLKEEVRLEDERAERNKKLVLELLREYGLGRLIDLVKEETGLDLTEHVYKFVNDEKISNEAIEGSVETDDVGNKHANEVAMFRNIMDKYTKFIREISTKNGIEIDNEITESLEKSRKAHDEKIKAIKDSNKAEIKRQKDEKYKELAKIDNIKIQNDLDKDEEDTLTKLSLKHRTKMSANIRDHGGSAWYIAMIMRSAVKYCVDENTLELSGKVNKLKLFYTETEAKSVYDKLKEIDDYKDCYIEISVLKVSNKDMLNIAEEKVDYLKAVLNDSGISISEAPLIKQAVLKANGIISNKTSGQVIVYTAKEKSGDGDVLFINGDTGLRLEKSIIDATLYRVSAERNVEMFNKINKRLSKNYIVEQHLIKFDSQWYADKIERLMEDNSEKQQLALLDMRKLIIKPGLNTLNVSNVTINKWQCNALKEFRKIGVNTVYYIASISNDILRYYTKYESFSESIANMQLFGTKEEVANKFKEIYKREGAIIYKVMKLKI